MPKRVNPRQANMVNDDVDMIVMVSDVCAMIFEVNLVGTNHGDRWIDTGATSHVCADKNGLLCASPSKRASQRAKVGYAPTPTCAPDLQTRMGLKLLNSCEPARPADTNAALKVRLCAYLFAADLFHYQIRFPEYSVFV
ncbi:hypothetical protein Tco_1327126 [Tanacetum coccineum]